VNKRSTSLLASKSSTATGGFDFAIDAALSKRVVHVSVPSEAVALALCFAAASSGTTMISSGESATHIMVSTAADKLVLGSGTGTTFILASLLNNKESFIGRLGPDSMSRFSPVGPVFVKSHSETSVALANSSSTVIFDGPVVIMLPPTVGTDNSSLGVVLSVSSVPIEFVTVSSDIGVAMSKVLFGASVAKPQVLARFINQIHRSTGTGYETMCALWQAPATIETVSGDSLIFRLEPRYELFKVSESLHSGKGLLGELRHVTTSSKSLSLDGVLKSVHVRDNLLHHSVVFDADEKLVHGIIVADKVQTSF
jgi:hypothetical protein